MPSSLTWDFVSPKQRIQLTSLQLIWSKSAKMAVSRECQLRWTLELPRRPTLSLGIQPLSTRLWQRMRPSSITSSLPSSILKTLSESSRFCQMSRRTPPSQHTATLMWQQSTSTSSPCTDRSSLCPLFSLTLKTLLKSTRFTRISHTTTSSPSTPQSPARSRSLMTPDMQS